MSAASQECARWPTHCLYALFQSKVAKQTNNNRTISKQTLLSLGFSRKQIDSRSGSKKAGIQQHLAFHYPLVLLADESSGRSTMKFLMVFPSE